MARKNISTASSRSKVEEPCVHNSLLRCIRSDNKAAAQFEPIDQVPGLWVLELGTETNSPSWSEWVTRVQLLLSQNQKFFSSLSKESSDYTLHITISLSESQRIVIPSAFSRIAAAIGFNIEIYRLDE